MGMNEMIQKTKRGCVLALFLLVGSSAIGEQDFNTAEAAKNGWTMEQNRSASWYLAQHKRIAAAMAGLLPQRPGIVDAYVVSIGLDSDPVFRREAGEATRVLARRYGATGRALFLSSGADDAALGTPQGSPENLATALAAVAAKMNRKEDVLILFVTTHGDPASGLVYRDGNNGVGMIAPQRLAGLIDELGIERRMILLSACYAGVFLPHLTNENSIIITAASSKRTSFGCAPGNDWTFFGDALINNAMRKAQPLDKAANEAVLLISNWETVRKLVPSRPQVFVGDKANLWLGPLEAKIPKTETAKVGRPAIETT